MCSKARLSISSASWHHLVKTWWLLSAILNKDKWVAICVASIRLQMDHDQISLAVQVTQALRAFLAAAANGGTAAMPLPGASEDPPHAPFHSGTMFQNRCAWAPINPMPTHPPTWALAQFGGYASGGSSQVNAGSPMLPPMAQVGALSGTPDWMGAAVYVQGVGPSPQTGVVTAGNSAKRQKTGVTGSSGPLGASVKTVFETAGALHDAELQILRVGWSKSPWVAHSNSIANTQGCT